MYNCKSKLRQPSLQANVTGGGGGGYIAGGDSEGLSYVNIIGNYFISGPSTSATAFTRGNGNFYGYVSQNVYDSDKDGVLNGLGIAATSSNYGGMVINKTKYDYPAPAKILTAQQSLDLALNSVGASLVRDSIDTRLIDEVKSYGTLGELISDGKLPRYYFLLCGWFVMLILFDRNCKPDEWSRNY